MQEFIARANIARFEALIAGEPDEAKRRVLEQMLDREKATLKGVGATRVAATATGQHHAPAQGPQLNGDSQDSPTN